MGKNKNRGDHRPWRQQGHAGSEYYGSGGGSWALWLGAWKQSPRARGRDQGPVFPAYDSDWKKSAEVMMVDTSGAQPAPHGGGIVRDVQQAINAARKAEQRLQKLQKEQLQRGQAWDGWVLKMREQYAKELERYKSEQNKLASEIADLEAQTRAAYLQVQDAAMHQQAGPAPPPPLEWESAMDVEDLTEEQTRAELTRILQKVPSVTSRSLMTPPRGTGAAPHTPARAGVTPEPAAHETSAADIYPSPLSASPGIPPAMSMPPGLADPRTSSLPTESAGQSALACKLSGKRKALRQALAPFGVGKPLRGQEEEEGGMAPDAIAMVPPDPGGPLIDDDHEELAAASRSPGFGRLE